MIRSLAEDISLRRIDMIRSLAEDISLSPTPREEIIEGVLREGGKMLIAGPFLDKRAILLMLMELTVSIAEGERWLGFPCHKSRVLYINLEHDRASCINSLNHIYDARQIPLKNPDNIHLWHLRGNAAPIEKLAPEIVRILTLPTNEFGGFSARRALPTK